jgi:hypothetical protein
MKKMQISKQHAEYRTTLYTGLRVTESYLDPVMQCLSTFVRPRPGIFFFL